MAGSKSITYEIQIKDAATGTLRSVKVEAKNVDEAVKKMAGQTEKAVRGLSKYASATVKDMAAITVVAEGVNTAVQGLNSVVADLTAAYQVQLEVETQLATNMRNTMNATDEQIQSIKELCSAQQQLGVIGDEVQLAGAQSLAMFATQTSTLELLIPAMNDLVAQQKGLNASAGDCANVAKMLGKALAGQTTVLRRYGLSFTEAQEKILKFGTEAERAAVLADIISSRVGGMNASLAKTDAGKMKQLTNALGDLKEQAGAALQSVQPYLTMGASLTTSITGFTKLAAAVKAATAALTLCRAAMAALGIGAVIVGLGTLINYLTRATAATAELTEAQERAKRVEDTAAQTYGSVKAALEVNIAKLKEFNGTREQEKKLVKEMNDTYGSSMGYFSSVSQWYQTLTANSEAYCRQLVTQAQLQMLAQDAASLESRRRAITTNADGSKKTFSHSPYLKKDEQGYYYEITDLKTGAVSRDRDKNTLAAFGRGYVEGAQMEFDELTQQLNGVMSQMQSLRAEASSITLPEIGAKAEPSLKGVAAAVKNLKEQAANAGADLSVSVWDLSTLEEYEARLGALRAAQQTANAREYAELQRQVDLVEHMADIFKAMRIPEPPRALTDQVNAALGAPGFNTSRPADLKLEGSRQPTAKLNNELKKTVDYMGEIQRGWGGIKSGASAVDTITEALRGNGSAWERVAGFIDGAIGLYQSITSVMTMVRALTNDDTATKQQNTTANVANAASGALAAHSGIPFAGVGIAAGMIAAMLALMASLPKFANGGIAFGPTVGLFGEYAGAGSNPEVVAPLSRLKGMIADTVPASAGIHIPDKIELRARGRDMVAVVDTRNRFTSRS